MAAGILLVALVYRWGSRARRGIGRKRLPSWLGLGLRIGLWGVAVALHLGSGVLFWFSHRLLPSEASEQLFVGVTYHRQVKSSPRPLIIHRAAIDLRAKGLSLLVTPGRVRHRRQLPARTTSAFVKEFRLQLAINGQTFFPFSSKSPWEYFPRPGDWVSVNGLNASRGTRYARRTRKHPTLYVSKDNRASIGHDSATVYNAISGDQLLLRAGARIARARVRGRAPQPRTAIGIDKARRVMSLVVVDGRQPNYSEGVSLWELAGIMESFGCHDALSMDGGGSSALIVLDKNGKPKKLNSPMHTRIPGRERPVANHLGVYAAGLDTTAQ